MIQNVVYNKTDLIDKVNKNRIAAVQRATYQNTLCSPGIGAEPQQAGKTHPFRISGSGVFLQVVYTLALLASLFSLQQSPYWYNNLYEKRIARKVRSFFRAG
jgi:hypothetical protein